MRLIILAGLPGVGKSHTARILAERLDAYYFDSDRFAKEYVERTDVDITSLEGSALEQKRLEGHRAKIDAILERFSEHETIILDTCFDIVESRALFFGLEGRGVELVIIELTCSEAIARERILEHAHDTERMVGTAQSRWEFYRSMREHWVPIERIDHTIATDTAYEEQLEQLVTALTSGRAVP